MIYMPFGRNGPFPEGFLLNLTVGRSINRFRWYMEAVIRFLKNWTLPVAMCVGAIGYFLFANLPFMAPLKPMTNALVAILTPLLIFAQLLLTFCKVSPQELVPSAWHGWLLLIQLFSCMVLAALLLWVPMNVEYKEVFEGAMVCFICPTATAAAVITGKLGGSASSLTTYTLLSNRGRTFGLPVGRAACRYQLFRCVSQDLE